MEVVSAPTIALCIFISMLAIGLAMLLVWFTNRNEQAALHWCVAFFSGATSGLLIAIFGPMVTPALLASTTLFTVAYVNFWAGYKSFNDTRVDPVILYGAPAVNIIAYSLIEPLRANPNYAASFQSAVVIVFSLASAHAIYYGNGNKRLNMTLPLTIFMFIHSGFHAAHIYAALFHPSDVVDGRMTATWNKAFMLESFLNVIVLSTGCLMLIKERSEEKHRIASETDSLTGIANRRAFVRQTETLLRSTGSNAVLAIIDLDHFKPINDQFGHQAGDRVLIEFSRHISSRLPAEALFGRIGGEEFAVFLPEGPYEAANLLNELRSQVANLSIFSSGVRIPLTVSIGFAAVEKAGTNFDHMVAAADCALYIAKEQGRNRVMSFSPGQRLHKVMENDSAKRIGLADQRISRRSTRSHKQARLS